MRSAETYLEPESGEELEKVLIELPADHWSGKGGERVWAKRLEESLYEVRNTPWYAYEVNWGDVVRCEGISSAGLPIVVDVVREGGHRTLRVFFEEIGADSRESILAEINRLGATYENGDDTIYSLDLEPDRPLEPLLDFLASEEEAGHLAWETGWL
jgi:hypothetical protein